MSLKTIIKKKKNVFEKTIFGVKIVGSIIRNTKPFWRQVSHENVAQPLCINIFRI